MKKLIIGIIIGIATSLIGGFIIVKAATLIQASQVLYSNTSTTATNVNEALDELLDKAVPRTYGLKVANQNSATINFKKNSNTLVFNAASDYTGTGSIGVYSAPDDIAYHVSGGKVLPLIQSFNMSKTTGPVTIDISGYDRILVYAIYGSQSGSTAWSGTLLITN